MDPVARITSRSSRFERLTLDAVVTLASVTLVAAGARWMGLNEAGAGFVHLVAVLLVASARGLFAGLLGSVLATLTFNYFFLPPLHTLSIDNSENWVALACFLVAAVAGGRLLAAAQSRAAEAAGRRADAERLYELCFGLLTADATPGGLRRAATRALEIVGARGGGILLREGAGDAEVHLVTGGDPADEHLAADRAEVRAALRGELAFEPRGDGTADAWVPLRLGRDSIGVLVALGTDAPDRVLEPAGRLLALAFEREKALAEATEIEALHRSQALATAMLRAVSHDLRSPLTALRMEIEALRRPGVVGSAGEPVVRALERDSARLARRIDHLLTLARLEGGVLRPRPEPQPPGDLLHQAREAVAAAADGPGLEVHVAQGTPDLYVDPALALEMLVNLVENALRASPAGEIVELSAHGEAGGNVRLEVLDRGPGLPPEVAQHFGAVTRQESLAAGSGSGLGLEIARSLAESCGGALHLATRPGGGTIAAIILPAAATSDPTEAPAAPAENSI